MTFTRFGSWTPKGEGTTVLGQGSHRDNQRTVEKWVKELRHAPNETLEAWDEESALQRAIKVARLQDPERIRTTIHEAGDDAIEYGAIVRVRTKDPDIMGSRTPSIIHEWPIEMLQGREPLTLALDPTVAVPSDLTLVAEVRCQHHTVHTNTSWLSLPVTRVVDGEPMAESAYFDDR